MGPRVIVVDDHARFRARARRILHASGFEVVGEALDGRGAIAAVARLHPELVLLDVALADLDGLEVASRLAAEPDPPAVVLVSNQELDEYGPLVIACGARGLIPKSRLSPDLLEAVLRGHPPAGSAGAPPAPPHVQQLPTEAQPAHAPVHGPRQGPAAGAGPRGPVTATG